jgi:transglutaminase-like putative cysteine protease
MELTIRHSTRYTYDRPGSCAVQRLRLTPVSTRAQTVHAWSIEAPGIERAATYTDGFGNVVHLITPDGEYDTIAITAVGRVETSDTGGVVGLLGEAANPRIFLRDTPLTAASPEIEALAEGLGEGSALSRLHTLLEAVAARVRYDRQATDSATSAAEAFAAGVGVCQDHAHIFLAAARRMRIPARYVTGYLHIEGETPALAHHAWAEAYLTDLGWVGFDPANHICPTERYVRLACGFDARSAAPIVGTRRGGGAESLAVDVVVQQQQ